VDAARRMGERSAPALLVVDPQHPGAEPIARAVGVLRAGGLVAFPTETVYGLGANALDADAVARIYAAKGRPAWNPVIAHVDGVSAARALTTSWPAAAQRLAHAFWPGPLTLVLPRAPHVPAIVSAGLDAVAVRVPSHPVALALLTAAGFPIAAPSANRFTQLSPTTAQHVVASLGNRVELVLDGGPSDVGIESTVCDLTGPVPTLLRPGMITRAQLERVLGRAVHVASQEIALSLDGPGADDPAPRSPGMAERHYAPRADVWLLEAAQPDVAQRVSTLRKATPLDEVVQALGQRRRDRTHGAGPVTALLLTPQLLPMALLDHVVHMPNDPAAYARQLYAALHAADAAQSSVIIIERPPNADGWVAILDRITRAAR